MLYTTSMVTHGRCTLVTIQKKQITRESQIKTVMRKSPLQLDIEPYFEEYHTHQSTPAEEAKPEVKTEVTPPEKDLLVLHHQYPEAMVSWRSIHHQVHQEEPSDPIS